MGRIAVMVAQVAFEEGLAGIAKPADVLELVKSVVWTPDYPRHPAS